MKRPMAIECSLIALLLMYNIELALELSFRCIPYAFVACSRRTICRLYCRLN